MRYVLICICLLFFTGPIASARPKTFGEMGPAKTSKWLFDARQDLIDTGRYPKSVSLDDIESGKQFVVLFGAILTLMMDDPDGAFEIADSICETLDKKDDQISKIIMLRIRASDGGIARPVTIVERLRVRLMQLSLTPKRHMISIFGQRDGGILVKLLF